MPLNHRNTRTFHRCLFGGITETITLLKRGDDQNQGTVTAFTLYQCHKSRVTKSGETIQGDMSSNHRALWHIPRVELDRVGVAYINAADRFVDKLGRVWQPEAPEAMDIKLFENYLDIQCVRRDEPNALSAQIPGQTPVSR